MILRCSLALTSVALICAAIPGKPEPPGPARIPTFARDIAPIMYSKCAPCHHQGEVAPFTLMSYEDLRDHAATVAAVVERKSMPPWQAWSHGEFEGERTLTVDQIAAIETWASNGAPAGDLSKAPRVPSFGSGWAIGKPDFVGKASAPYPINADGSDDYRCFVIPTNYPEGRYVTGVELRPGNRKVVHHVLVYVDTNGVARAKKSKDGKPGYASFGGPGFVPTGSLGGWAPGLQPVSLPKGTGLWLPKGADIVLQVHYHKDGKPETDQTQIGLVFAPWPVDKRVRWEAVSNLFIDIPAGDSKYELKSSLKLPAAITVLDLIPHMHLLGHDMTVTATPPGSQPEQLVHVEPYDFNWQTRYTFRKPIELPKGTELSMVAHYDNSSANLHNPNSPPKEVTFGEQTTNEMCFAFFSYTFDDEHITKGKTIGEEQSLDATDQSVTLDKIFDHYDADHSGYLEEPELANTIRFFRTVEADPDDKSDADTASKFLLAMYGKEKKGSLSRAEFKKMIQTFSKK